MSAVMMPLAELLDQYSDGDEHGWDVEFALLRSQWPDYISILTASIRFYGIREPILLGPDRRVWDGHHRLCVADGIGLTEVPVAFAVDDLTATPP